MKTKNPFSIRKVIDPHENMPEEIKNAFFKIIKDWDWWGQNTYFEWRIGNGSEATDLESGKILDDWLLNNGISTDESVLLLCWW